MSLVRKGILVSAGQGVCVGISILVGIIFSRTLGPDGMGQYELLRSTAIIAITFFCAGVGNANVFFLNNRRIPAVEIASNGLWISAVIGGLAGMALILTVMNFPNYFGVLDHAVIAALALGVAASIGMWTLRAVIVAQLDVSKMILIDLTIPAILLIGGGSLAILGLLKPQGAVVILSGGFCASFALTVYYIRGDIEIFRRFDWSLFRSVFGYAISIAAANFLTVLSANVAVMLLRYIRHEQFTEVGFFTRAVAVCGLVRLIPWAVGPLLYARWAGAKGDARTHQAEMAVRMSTTYGVLAALFLALFGKYVILLLYGEVFIPAQEALIILAPGVVFMAVFSVLNNLLTGDGRAKTAAVMLLGTLLIITVITWLTVPFWGIRGAAFGTLCGNGFLVVTSMTVCCRLYGMKPVNCLMPRVDDLRYIRRALRDRGNEPKECATAPTSGD